MPDDFLSLPIAAQISLGSGYLAYLIACAGLRQSHTTADALFRSIAFGLVATGVLLWAPLGIYGTPPLAFVATLLSGAIWRFRGVRWSRRLLDMTHVSWSDDVQTAWLSITAESTSWPVSQIAVDLEDGRVLMCDDTRAFTGAPHGPCVLGLDGSVALYVNAERRADGSWLEHHDLRTVDGDKMTYVPASSAKRIELRFWSPATEKAALAEAQEQVEAAEAVEIAAGPSQGYRSADRA